MSKYLISLDKFEVIKEISHSQNYIFLLVEDKETKKQYVAKVCKTEEDQQSQIDHTINSMNKFKHPIVNLFLGYSPKNFLGEDHLTIISNYYPKGDLFNFIHQNQVDNTTRQIILVGISYGMKYLHQMNIVHRDLKLSNILIDDDLQPHITYFNFFPTNDSGAIIATPIYLAPEIIEGNHFESSADVYSFGFLMYEVITGKQSSLDGANTSYQVFLKSTEGVRPEIPSFVKKPIKDMIDRCWSCDPDNRPTFDELFQKLAYDPNFLLDDVDTEKLNSYIDMIK